MYRRGTHSTHFLNYYEKISGLTLTPTLTLTLALTLTRSPELDPCTSEAPPQKWRKVRDRVRVRVRVRVGLGLGLA